MKRKIIVVVSMTVLLLLGSTLAFGQNVKGMIMDRTGETLIVKGAGGTFTVVLTDETRTVDKRGLFGLRKDQLSNIVLIPGLKVNVKGTTDSQGRVVAQEIVTDGDDLETSEMIQAGLHPTAEQVAANVKQLEVHSTELAAHKENIETNKEAIAANKEQIQANIQDIEAHTQRFMALTDFDTKAEATVNFAVGSSKLSAEGEEELKKVAETAKGLTGYIIEVVGYADSTGDAAMNTRLSEQRAKAVCTFLFQQGGIPIRHIVAPGAMGEYGAAAPNETKEGRAQNRRVEVKVLVNKGLAGS
jgi:outer membrane protein OmpA-like peptidoglycan-associated protein